MQTLRGYLYQRFVGDASLYGGAEVRQPIGWVFRHSVPMQIGVLALADAGRVWADGTESTRVHASAGGGMWLAFFDPRYAVSLTAANGREGTRWYLTERAALLMRWIAMHRSEAGGALRRHDAGARWTPTGSPPSSNRSAFALKPPDHRQRANCGAPRGFCAAPLRATLRTTS